MRRGRLRPGAALSRDLASRVAHEAREKDRTDMMPFVTRLRRLAAAALLLALCLPLNAGWAQRSNDAPVDPPLILDLEWLAPSEGLSRRPPPPPLPEGASSPMTALSRGRWMEACGTASRILAQQVPDTEALGLFALCAALAGDDTGTTLALARLSEVERPPRFAPIAAGIRLLKLGRPQAASVHFEEALRRRGDDPLASYFQGEALHAAGRDPQALLAFEAVLKAWPAHVPAITAAARVRAAAVPATESDLLAARELAERATQLDPWTPANWRLLADLCRRTGQSDRAEAIALQWLRGPGVTR
jgi:tetratricopeptide (TPR) repeat protein